MDDVDRHHPCALAPTTARCTSALGAKLARARFLANSVKWQYFLHGRWVLSAGAPGEIRTPDPQIRSLMLYAAAQKRSSTMAAQETRWCARLAGPPGQQLLRGGLTTRRTVTPQITP